MGVMGGAPKIIAIATILYLYVLTCECAKINTPRVLLPWFENLNVNFTFEIIEGGCYTWSLSRNDIIDLEPHYEDSWGHCSRSARVSVSKTCVPPGSVIILAEEVNSGEILRGDVDIGKINSLKVMSTTWKLYLEEAPEAFEVIAYDNQGNKFSTLEGVSFKWTIENIGDTYGDNPLVTLVRWSDTDYEAPRGIAELEANGLRSHSVLLYGQAMGESRVTVCLENICTKLDLRVVASVVLTPAIAYIAPGDTLQYRVVRAKAGRLTVQNVAETLYNVKVPDTGIANLEDAISLVRGTALGSSSVHLMSGTTEVATATLTVVEPHSIRVSIRPSDLLVVGDCFTVHCVVFDEDGHPLNAGQETLIRLTVDGEANVELLRSTENGTITDAVAENVGKFTIIARLHSIAGRPLLRKVEGEASAVAVNPLEIVPPELFVAWTDTIQDVQLHHIGGGDEPVTWSESEEENSPLSVAPTGVVTVRGEGFLDVRVHLTKYPHVRATGRVWSSAPELLSVAGAGRARAGRPHALHVALAARAAGDLYYFHRCDCGTFAVSLLEGPEPHNVTSAPWIPPMDGACCVLEVTWESRGTATLRVSRGRTGATTLVVVTAAPLLLWPQRAAALAPATLPVIAEGESLVAQSSEPRIAELLPRAGPPPHAHPDALLYTLSCKRKGDAQLELWAPDEGGREAVAPGEGGREAVTLGAACAPLVSRLRLDPPPAPGNCSAGARVWLRPGQEVMVKVTLFDAIGRELLDEQGPRVSWEVQPSHIGIQYKATDRLFVETNPEFYPVPVPDKFYQVVIASDQAIGWTGTLKASIPDATATIQAKVVAPLKCDPMKVNMAWEGETVPNIARVTGGSGRYSVEAPKGVSATVEGGAVAAVVPAPGAYDLVLADRCVGGERQIIELNIEEVLSLEVISTRAVCVGGCVPISAVVKGVSHRYLSSRQPDWRTAGQVTVKDGQLCGIKEGLGRVSAGVAGVWSAEVEVTVFPPLKIVPGRARLPPGGRLQLRHEGGPPPHLAALAYAALRHDHVDVSPTGIVQGLSVGTARIKLIASDISELELASAEAEVEVIQISQLLVRAATQTLLVGQPAPVWIEAAGLRAAMLGALQPAPRVTWALRDPASARLYVTHVDDQLERSVAEGLTVRVVPLKPGVITLDVRVRNLGQVAETRSWDSTIEILGVSDIRASVDGISQELNAGDRLSLAVGASARLKATPRGSWTAFENGVFELKENGEVKGIRPGFGVVFAKHKDDRNNIDRETAIHVEVGVPAYCTAESGASSGARLVARSELGRPLLASRATVAVAAPHAPLLQAAHASTIDNEVILTGVEDGGAFVTFHMTVGGVTVSDEVWIGGSDSNSNRIIACGAHGVCLEGVGWRAPPGVALYAGSGLSLAVLARDQRASHTLRLERPAGVASVHQLPVHKMEFLAGEWPSSLVPLVIEAVGLTSGPLLCTEEQKYALDGVQVELPYSCRTKAPHTAQAVLDIPSGQLACSIIPASEIKDASEIELCAEWGAFRTCTKVLLLPLLSVSHSKVSLLDSHPTFTINGHPRALKLVKLSTSPGLKLEINSKNGEIVVNVKSESVTCGIGWVNVISRLTSQELRVEVERECDIACGTLLGAIFSLIKPYLPTLMTVVAIAAACLYVQARLQEKAQIRLPRAPEPPRARAWSRSPRAAPAAAPASAPAAPVYGDTSALPDTSFSPASQMHSRFL